MPNIFIALILVAAVVLISLLLILISKRSSSKKTSSLLARFSQLGTENRLSFSSQEILKHSVIGLDGIQKKLLHLQEVGEKKYNAVVVDLNEVIKCTLKRHNTNFNAGTSKKPRMESYLERVVLQFEFADSRQLVEVPFFIYQDNHLFEISELEARAKDWEMILSKLVSGNSKKSA